MRYLGIDYGSKKIGLAISDENGTMGFPLSIIPTTKDIAEKICEIIIKEDVKAVVIGESRDLSGRENPIAPNIRSLGEEVESRLGVRVYYEPEMYTSAEARRAPTKEKRSRSPKKRIRVDASAAALILTNYLSRTKHG